MSTGERKHARWFRPVRYEDTPAKAKWDRKFSRPTLSTPRKHSTCRRLQYQSDAHEIAQAEMWYREGKVSFSELFMFCQSFKPEVTVDDVIGALGRHYRGE